MSNLKIASVANKLGCSIGEVRKRLKAINHTNAKSCRTIPSNLLEQLRELGLTKPVTTQSNQLEQVTPPEPKQIEQTSNLESKELDSSSDSAITSTSDNSQITQEEHLQQTKEALEIVQKGFSEQNLQDAIALGTLDGIQKVALRLQTARKTELDLLAQLSQANQQTTQSQLNQASELFNDLMNSQNGEVETLGKSQLASHKHEKERQDAIAKGQTLMQSMI